MLTIYHGSNYIIDKPSLSLGKKNNDFGQGFYCTTSENLAGEWACKNNQDGFINKYELDDSNLKILNLLDGNYNILNWIALLLKNRTFTISNPLVINRKDYLIDKFGIDLNDYDIVIGYRADDSYFSYANDFVNGVISIDILEKALKLGNLGSQIVLISDKAFNNLSFISSEFADNHIYYPKFRIRDYDARDKYFTYLKKHNNNKTQLYITDIIREEIENDDSRLPRILSK